LSFLKSNKIKNQIKKNGYPPPKDSDTEKNNAQSRRSKSKEPVKI
jgi:hypothetical protein